MNQDVKEQLISVEGLQEGLRETCNVGIVNEGVCPTAAGTAAKTVTLGTTFSLTDRATIIVSFTNGITVDNATLAVTHTTLDGTTVTESAKPIYLNGAALGAGNVAAGTTLILRYDGTAFNIIGGAGTGDGYVRPSGGIPLTDLSADVQSAITAVSDIEEVIPTQASETNQLADKDFVNSSVSTSTAEYRGNYNSVTDLSLTVGATHAEIAAALGSAVTTADNNDYSFVQIPTSDSTPSEIGVVERYKHDGTQWAFEYALNNSGFTAAQWAALNSNITSGLVTKLSALPSSTELTALLNGKYAKPDGGIPASDMASAVQTSLGKADTALQAHQTVALASGTNNGTVKLTVGGTVTDNVAVKGLGTAAYKGVASEVSTSTNLVQAGGVKTYVDDRIFIPVPEETLTTSSTFAKRSVIGINGVLYYATEDVSNLPLDFIVQDGSFVTYEFDGKQYYMLGSDTVNSGWAVLADVSMDEYSLSQKQEKATTLAGYGITDAYTRTQIDALTRNTRKTDFDLDVLKQAVADRNLEKYGLKVGDEKTINDRTYVIADLNTMKGTSTPYRIKQYHAGLIVIPHTRQKWNVSGNTYTGADGRGAGYANSDLHYYLVNTLLPLVREDLGETNLLAHSKLLTNAVSQNGYNRTGGATGCSSGWDWVTDQYICALSEVQVYGSTVWSSSGYDTGEACRQLEVFRKYSHTDIFGNEYVWLRDVASASDAAGASYYGRAYLDTASALRYVAALILFK